MLASINIHPDGVPAVTIPEDTATAGVTELTATVLGLIRYGLRANPDDHAQVADAIKNVVTQVAEERDRLAAELAALKDRRDRVASAMAHGDRTAKAAA